MQLRERLATMGQVHLPFSAVLTGGVNDCSKATWLHPSSHCFSCSFVHPRASARTSWWSGQQLKTGQCSAFQHPCQSREVFREQKAVFIPLPGLGFKSLFLVVMNCLCFSACLLPVLVEEEESVHDSAADAPTVSASVEGGKKAGGRWE